MGLSHWIDCSQPCGDSAPRQYGRAPRRSQCPPAESSSNFLARAFSCYGRCPCFYSSMQFTMTNATEVELRQRFGFGRSDCREPVLARLECRSLRVLLMLNGFALLVPLPFLRYSHS